MFAHAEAIRLSKEALSIVRDLAPGKDRDSQELAVLEGLAAPLNARYGLFVPRIAGDARALDPPGRIAGPHRFQGQRHGGAVGVAVSSRDGRPMGT